ncbi:MAG: DUF433 domain-containing protein [Chthoniobacterales bacterium]
MYALTVTATATLIGRGIYTVPDAARLSKVTPRRIRYWLQRQESESSPPTARHALWTGEHAPIDDKVVLGFLDLQEVRFVDAFLKAGVSWRFLRRAHEIAKSRYQTQHPFCIRKFATDGKQIIDLLGQAEGMDWEEIVLGQRVFPVVVAPFLRDLEFSNNQIARWWPLGPERRVVLDPNRQFGQPIIFKAGVPTEVLYLAVKNATPKDQVARWFEVEREDIEDAVEFETRLAA